MTFENDFAAVLPPPGPIAPMISHPLLTTEPVQGGCDVLCFHPRHDLTLARLEVEAIEKIIEEWTRVYLRRGRQEGIKYVQIFEVFSQSFFQKKFFLGGDYKGLIITLRTKAQ